MEARVKEVPMPLFGAHMSIAGGLHNAVASAVSYHCDTLQLFTGAPQSWPFTHHQAAAAEFRSGGLLSKNSNQWHAPPLSDDDARRFRRAVRQAKLRLPIVHDSYLI